jgi:hypothetical protein
MLSSSGSQPSRSRRQTPQQGGSNGPLRPPARSVRQPEPARRPRGAGQAPVSGWPSGLPGYPWPPRLRARPRQPERPAARSGTGVRLPGKPRARCRAALIAGRVASWPLERAPPTKPPTRGQIARTQERQPLSPRFKKKPANRHLLWDTAKPIAQRNVLSVFHLSFPYTSLIDAKAADALLQIEHLDSVDICINIVIADVFMPCDPIEYI